MIRRLIHEGVLLALSWDTVHVRDMRISLTCFQVPIGYMLNSPNSGGVSLEDSRQFPCHYELAIFGQAIGHMCQTRETRSSVFRRTHNDFSLINARLLNLYFFERLHAAVYLRIHHFEDHHVMRVPQHSLPKTNIDVSLMQSTRSC